MLKQAKIYYPTDENAVKHIKKEIAIFYCNAAVKYIESLKLNDKQIEMLFSSLEDDVSHRKV